MNTTLFVIPWSWLWYSSNYQKNTSKISLRQQIQAARKPDIDRRREYIFLLWYFSHKDVWDDYEIHNEIQSIQQYPSTKVS